MEWGLFELPEDYLAALKRLGFDTPDDLRKRNRLLYAKILRFSICKRYDRIAMIHAKTVRMSAVRRILARVYDLSLERVTSIIYRRDSKNA
jgi:hypothetical protein